MEWLVVGSEVFESPGSFIPGLVLVVIATARILLGYLAEEKAKRVRMERREEPFAPAPHPTRGCVLFRRGGPNTCCQGKTLPK